MSMSNEKAYIGNVEQLLTVQESVLRGGWADGTKKIDIANDTGLSVIILPDRGMDIYQARLNGKNVNYIAPQGIVAPSYFDDKGLGFLRSFHVGLLTTIGMQNIGGPTNAGGEERGLHGRIANIPASDVKITRCEIDGEPAVEIEGTMREARLFGENLALRRKYTFFARKNDICIEDTVTNDGFAERPYVFGYHINYGYPLLSEDTVFTIQEDQDKIVGRDDEAKKYFDSWNQIEAPQAPFPERCYFHETVADENGMTGYEIANAKAGVGVRVCYKKDELPFFTEWKMMGKGEYVLGLEPTNAFLDGAKIGEEGCEARVLSPGASESYALTFSFFTP